MKQIILIDFDSTFVKVEALEELADIVLQSRKDKEKIIQEIKEITALGMEGKISFSDSLGRRLKLFNPNKKHIQQLVALLQKSVTTSIERNKKFFQENAKDIYIISGGFKEYILPIVLPFGIAENHVVGNTIIFDKKSTMIDFSRENPLMQKKGKAKAVKELRLRKSVIIVGDGYTDWEIKEAGFAEKFVAFTENIARKPVIEKADTIAKSFEDVITMTNRKKKLKALLLEGLDKETVEIFKKEGIEIEYHKRAFLEEELIEKIKDVDILGIRTRTPVTKRVLDYANKLKVIGAFCTGTEHVDIQAAEARGMSVFHSPYGSARSVVELVIGCMIMLFRQVPDKNTLMHQGVWDKSFEECYEIKGKTLGIIGYGHIGSMLSVVADALGMNVLFYDSEDKMPYARAKNTETLKALLNKSDVVTIHVDGRKENTNFIGKKEFKQMKQGVIFINASRGHVVDYTVLVDCIKKGKVKGAAIDVFVNNPLKRGDPFVSPLQNLPNVILTPHLGGSTEEALRARGISVAKKIINYLHTQE